MAVYDRMLSTVRVLNVVIPWVSKTRQIYSKIELPTYVFLPHLEDLVGTVEKNEHGHHRLTGLQRQRLYLKASETHFPHPDIQHIVIHYWNDNRVYPWRRDQCDRPVSVLDLVVELRNTLPQLSPSFRVHSFVPFDYSRVHQTAYFQLYMK